MKRKQIKNFFKIGNKTILNEGLNMINLTNEELEIVDYLIKEESENKISLELNYSLRTLQRRKKRIYDKTYNALKDWDKLDNF